MSKRAQDIQGGSDRYTGMSGSETPAETPTRATPAQLARRKIAGLKGRPIVRPPSQASSGALFSAGFSSQQASQPPAQPSFNFSQPSAPPSNMFGQSQPSNTFNFGQSTSTSTFQFGSSGAQSGGFSFGLDQANASNDGAIRNPFAQANDSQSSQATPAPASTGSSSNIFNFGQTKPAGTTNDGAQPSSSFFSFGATPQGLDAAARQEIMDRQYILSTEQLHRFEDIVKDNVELWDGQVKCNNLDQLPADKQQKLKEFVRSLPAPTGSETRASFGLFGEQGRGRTKEWVTDAQRAQIKQAATSMTPEQHEKLAQVARDEFRPLSQLKSTEMPALEQLPHDVQHKMLQYAQNPNAASASTSTPTPFSKPAASTSSLFSKPAGSETSPVKANPFGGFTFGGSPSKNDKDKPAESGIPGNIFQNISDVASSSERRKSMAQDAPNAPVAAPASQSGPSKPLFSFNGASEPSKDKEAASSTAPAGTPFIFNASKSPSPTTQPPTLYFTDNPVPPGTTGQGGIFSAGAPTSQSQSNIFGSTAHKPLNSQSLFSSPTSSQATSAVKSGVVESKAQWSFQDLNRAVLKHLMSCNKDEDWSSAMKFYLHLVNQKQSTQTGASPPSPSAKRKAEEQLSRDPNRRFETGAIKSPETESRSSSSGFTFTPQKPLSQTASLFNDILSAPAQSPQQASNSTTQTSPAKPSSNLFGSPAATAKPAAPEMPKFTAAPTNFMAAFGQKAQKQAEKNRAERKAEEFDSDEDDEAEWERKDKERQEAKAKEAATASKKVMKQIDGKFVWVDESAKETSEAPSGTSSEGDETASVFSTQATPSQPGNLFSFSANKPDESPKPTSTLFSSSSGTNESTSAKSAPTFSFGASQAPPKETTTPTGSPAKQASTGFSFAPASTQARDNAKPKFNFGQPAAPQPEAPSLFSSSNGSTSGSSLFSKADAPAASSLFSSGKTPSVFSTNSGTPSVFASPNLSNTTTPAASTESEGQGDEDAMPKEDQRDLTSLTREERETEDVLFECKSRLRKYVRGAEEPWQVKGVGVMRVLKNKASGSARVLMRQDPNGSIMLNSSLLKNKESYSAMNDTNVKVTLPGEANDLSTYRLTFGKKEKAAELLKTIHDVLCVV